MNNRLFTNTHAHNTLGNGIHTEFDFDNAHPTPPPPPTPPNHKKAKRKEKMKEAKKTDLHMILSIHHKFSRACYCCWCCCCALLRRYIELHVAHHIYVFGIVNDFSVSIELHSWVCGAENLFIFLAALLLCQILICSRERQKPGKEKGIKMRWINNFKRIYILNVNEFIHGMVYTLLCLLFMVTALLSAAPFAHPPTPHMETHWHTRKRMAHTQHSEWEKNKQPEQSGASWLMGREKHDLKQHKMMKTQ